MFSRPTDLLPSLDNPITVILLIKNLVTLCLLATTTTIACCCRKKKPPPPRSEHISEDIVAGGPGACEKSNGINSSMNKTSTTPGATPGATPGNKVKDSDASVRTAKATPNNVWDLAYPTKTETVEEGTTYKTKEEKI
uniref:Uncharacterized protein n=1 Tax=Panagrellus redivivus TaxID=6233 RepID=A0A7E4VJ25_PANRE